MIKSPKVGQIIWVVYDPVYGSLKYPVQDKIIQIPDTLKNRVLLEKTNHIKEESTPWSNDIYGNFVEIEYLYELREDALEYLREVYSKRLRTLKEQCYQLEMTMACLV